MKKIAHICTSGISHKILADKLTILQRSGHDVHLISSPEGYDEEHMKLYDLKLGFIPMNRNIHLLDDARSILRMRKLFRKERFDVVHTHTAKAGFIGRVAAWLAGIPAIVHTSHGLPFYEGQPKVKHFIYKSLERLGAKFCHAIASQNEEDLGKLRQLAPGKKLYYEGNGVDLLKLDTISERITPEQLRAIREQHRIPHNKKIILMAARFEPVKDHAFLLDGLEELKRQYKDDFVCLLAGKGPLEQAIREKIQESGLEQNVFIVGHQADIYPFIKLADIVVLTSEKEGIPRFLMESMAFQKPVVASDVLGTRELVRHRDTGYLVPYKNAKQLASSIHLLLQDESLCMQMGVSARQTIETQFTEQLVVRRLERMYEDLAVKRRNALPLFNRIVKRIADLAVAVPAVLMLSPVYALTALLIRLKLGSPVLFKQQRPGLHGKPFHVYKFRTMTNATGASGELLSDADRLTAFGKLLRKLSLDEIPQLWNVIRGEMSLVGPRPLLMEYLPLYTEDQARRHLAKPGITGHAQVNGRNALSWEDKFALDVWYVDHQSFWLDLKIIFLTVIKVFRREGIAQEGHATARKFTGNENVRGYL